MKKPVREIYGIRVREIDADSQLRPVIYMVGNQVQSYTGKPTVITSITKRAEIITIAFADDTERIFGYKPQEMDLFTRTKIKTDAGTNNNGDNSEGA
jgi:hypothetical protein